MIRRLLIPLLGSGLLLAASAGSVLAKCEGPNPPAFCGQVIVDMSVGDSGGIFQAGIATSVDIHVSQGEQPFEALGVVLTFTRIADGSSVRAPATAAGQAGAWRTDVLLPDGGAWTVVAQVIDSGGGAFLVPLNSVQVPRPPALPPAGKPVTPATPTHPASPALPAWPIAVLLVGALGAGLLGYRLRSRRRSATAWPSRASSTEVRITPR